MDGNLEDHPFSFDQVLNWEENSNYDCWSVMTSSNQFIKKKKNYTLICHDMMGGYVDDRYWQGKKISPVYYIYNWHMIDIFIYFSHNFLSLPPKTWISCCNKNNTTILATIIIEKEELLSNLFDDDAKLDKIVQNLANISQVYKFDGYFINFECNIKPIYLKKLEYFISLLTTTLKSINADSKVIWYDSIINNSTLSYQNMLNNKNIEFFNCCDGIFLNYWWSANGLSVSKMAASSRYTDVYVGIDVFGRGVKTGDGWSINKALNIINRFGLSMAIFAPGWVFENNDPESFRDNDMKFWSLLNNELQHKIPCSLPFFSNFFPGHAKSFTYAGKSLHNFNNYYNIGLQTTTINCLYGCMNRKLKDWICYLDSTHSFEFGHSLAIKYKGNSSQDNLPTTAFKILKCSLKSCEENMIVHFMIRKNSIEQSCCFLLKFSNNAQFFLLNKHSSLIKQSINNELIENHEKVELPPFKNSLTVIDSKINGISQKSLAIFRLPKTFETYLTQLYFGNKDFNDECWQNYFYQIPSLFFNENLNYLKSISVVDSTFSQMTNPKSLNVDDLLNISMISIIGYNQLIIDFSSIKAFCYKSNNEYIISWYLDESNNVINGYLKFENIMFFDVFLKNSAHLIQHTSMDEQLYFINGHYLEFIGRSYLRSFLLPSYYSNVNERLIYVQFIMKTGQKSSLIECHLRF